MRTITGEPPPYKVFERNGAATAHQQEPEEEKSDHEGLGTGAMMSCRNVSTRVSMGNLDQAPLAQRMTIWLHLAMCRHCRAFRQQIVRIGRAALLMSQGFEREPSHGFEDRIVQHLGALT